MKMKSFALLAMSGLFATFLTSVTPAMADDISNDPAMQTPSDNTNTQTNNIGGSSPADTSNYNSNSSNSSDAASPDTATGDDDY